VAALIRRRPNESQVSAQRVHSILSSACAVVSAEPGMTDRPDLNATIGRDREGRGRAERRFRRVQALCLCSLRRALGGVGFEPTEPRSCPPVRRTSALRAAARRHRRGMVGSVPPAASAGLAQTRSSGAEVVILSPLTGPVEFSAPEKAIAGSLIPLGSSRDPPVGRRGRLPG
jgi:hypothetical protein